MLVLIGRASDWLSEEGRLILGATARCGDVAVRDVEVVVDSGSRGSVFGHRSEWIRSGQRARRRHVVIGLEEPWGGVLLVVYAPPNEIIGTLTIGYLEDG